MGIIQRFRFENPRLEDAAARRPQAHEKFETTAAFCFTLESEGMSPHHTSLPKDPMYFADFRARMTERYAPAQQRKAVA